MSEALDGGARDFVIYLFFHGEVLHELLQLRHIDLVIAVLVLIHLHLCIIILGLPFLLNCWCERVYRHRLRLES